MAKLKELENKARILRKHIIKMTCAAGSGTRALPFGRRYCCGALFPRIAAGPLPAGLA